MKINIIYKIIITLIFFIISEPINANNKINKNTRKLSLEDPSSVTNNYVIATSNIDTSISTSNYLLQIQPLLYDKHLISKEIPEPFINQIIINPFETATTKQTVELTGNINRKFKCFINGKPIISNNNGDFITTISLDHIGSNTIYISIITPKNKLFTITKQINKLLIPKELNNYSKNLKYYTYFYNTNLLYDAKNTPLSKKLTRQDLAYFCYQIKHIDEQNESNSKLFNINISDSFKKYIDFAINQNLMSEFTDGQFYPNKFVTKMEALITIIRLQNIRIDEKNTTIPYIDITSNHWSKKFLATGLKHNLIKPNKYFYPQKELTFHEFLNLVENLPSVTEKLTQLKKPTETNININDYISKNIPSINLIKTRIEKFKLLQKIHFKTPENNMIVYNDTVTINGQIYPPNNFKINNTIISPNVTGEFTLKAPVTYGKNRYEIQTSFNKTTLTCFKLEAFDDLTDHWFKKDASKLRYLNYVSQNNSFFPKKNISLDEFINYIDQFTNITLVNNTENLSNTSHLTISNDITTANMLEEQNKQPTPSISSSNILEIIIPQTTHIKRIHAIHILSQILQNSESYSPMKQTKQYFPFIDIYKNNIYFNDVKYCLETGLISSSHNFYPNKKLTKAELIKILSNLPNIKNLLQETFND